MHICNYISVEHNISYGESYVVHSLGVAIRRLPRKKYEKDIDYYDDNIGDIIVSYTSDGNITYTFDEYFWGLDELQFGDYLGSHDDMNQHLLSKFYLYSI